MQLDCQKRHILEGSKENLLMSVYKGVYVINLVIKLLKHVMKVGERMLDARTEGCEHDKSR